VIIRILTEGQYRLEGSALVELDRIDDTLLDAISTGDAEAFRQQLQKVVSVVKSRGSQVPDGELLESELIIPPSDTTLEEARELFDTYPRNLVGD
jgi:hypothetical protein